MKYRALLLSGILSLYTPLVSYAYHNARDDPGLSSVPLVIAQADISEDGRTSTNEAATANGSQTQSDSETNSINVGGSSQTIFGDDSSNEDNPFGSSWSPYSSQTTSQRRCTFCSRESALSVDPSPYRRVIRGTDH